MLKFKSLLFALIAFAAAFNVSAASSLWSASFSFDGDEITDDPILLLPTDQLSYSSAMAGGTPHSLTIIAEDTDDPEITADIFAAFSETPVEGTTVWDYTGDEYGDLPTDDTYKLIETVEGDMYSVDLIRFVTILPEPVGFLFAGLLCAVLLRKKMKGLIALLVAAAIASTGAFAESSVTEVSCLQMWPFSRSVIINYTIESDIQTNYYVKFYGTFDGGSNFFDLAEKGTLRKDGSAGSLPSAGKYKTIWSPDESFFGTHSDQMKVRVEVEEYSPHLYMVVDLTNGETSYLGEVPEGGWTDEYKTTKLVLRRIDPGTFVMGSPEGEIGRVDNEVQHQVTLTNTYYIAVFETTQKQYELITGENSSENKGDTRPVDTMTYNLLRGTDKGAAWPNGSDVDEDSVIGKFRAKLGKPFDLPTEAQWEYACRALTTTALNNGKDLSDEKECEEMAEVGRYEGNQNDGKGGFSEHTVVGSYLPNAWGLYDMHGNNQEWCLDWFGDYTGDAVEPKGAESGEYRIVRGGCWPYYCKECRSAYRWNFKPDTGFGYYGFRLVLVQQ